MRCHLARSASGARATSFVSSGGVSDVTKAQPVRPTEPEIRVVRTLADGAEFDLFIPADLACLDGHFPHMPIVPGVAMIDWAVKLAARHLNFPIDSAQAFVVKFRRIAIPNMVVTLSLRHTGPWRRLNFQYNSGVDILRVGAVTSNGS